MAAARIGRLGLTAALVAAAWASAVAGSTADEPRDPFAADPRFGVPGAPATWCERADVRLFVGRLALLHRHRFGEVARLVDIGALGDGGVIGQ